MTVEKAESNAPLVEAIGMEVVSARNPLLARVRDCNWKASPGDFWLIAGAHGSGKSDFVSTAAGLQRPGAGSLRLFGEDVAGLGESAMLPKRLRIGFVFKSGGRMFPNLTVAENIALPLRYHREMTAGELGKTVGELAEWTGLAEMAAHETREIGANWLSRVGLARALALRPEILFLDEPMSGLEARHRRWWVDFVSRLSTGAAGYAGKGMTLVVAASDADAWLDAGRQFALIRGQRFQVLGSREELREAEASWVESERTLVWTRTPGQNHLKS